MECPFCDTVFKKKYILLAHLSKKFKCKTTYSLTDYENVIEQLKETKFSKGTKLEKPIPSEIPIIETEVLKDCGKDGFKCKDCDSILKNKRSIYYHKRNACNKGLLNNTNPIVKDIILSDLNPQNYSSVMNDVSKLINESVHPVTINFINNSINNSTVNSNNTQNVQINDYGKEDLSYLKHTDIIEAGPWQTVPRLFEKIHFNPEHQENFNIKIKPNDKSKFIDILFQGKWVKRLKYDELSEKEEKLRNFIIDFARENKSIIPDKILERIDEYEEKMENMDKSSKEYQYILSKLEEIGMKGFVIMEANLNEI